MQTICRPTVVLLFLVLLATIHASTVYQWGENYEYAAREPTLVQGLPQDVIQVATSVIGSYALTSNGTLYFWVQKNNYKIYKLF